MNDAELKGKIEGLVSDWTNDYCEVTVSSSRAEADILALVTDEVAAMREAAAQECDALFGEGDSAHEAAERIRALGPQSASTAQSREREIAEARLDEARDWLMSEALTKPTRMEWKIQRITELERAASSQPKEPGK